MSSYESLNLLLEVLTVLQKLSQPLSTRNGNERVDSRIFPIQLRTAIVLLRHQLLSIQPSEWGSIEPHVEAVMDCLENLCSDRIMDASDNGTEFTRLKSLTRCANISGASHEELVAMIPLLDMEKSKVGRATATMADCIDMLSAVLPDALEGAHIRNTPKRPREPPSGFWYVADQLFNSISVCHSGTCNIHPEFEARLVLSTYLGRSAAAEGFDIEVLCSLDTDHQGWAEIGVLAPESRSAAAPRVRFEDPEIQVRPRWYVEKPNMVQFICKSIRTGHIGQVFRFNFVLDNEKLWQHRTSERHRSSERMESVTLYQLLSAGLSEWSAVDKLVLALILGYSLFYFYDGSWLGGRWTRHNIVFFTKAGSIPLQPFLRFSRSKSALESQHMDENGFLHRYPSILEFGVTLLEVDLGRSLESVPSCIKEITSIDDQYAKACDVFKKRRPYIWSKHYREAINACLYEDFSSAESECAERFRNRIYETIVRPLEEELHNSCQEFISLEMLDTKAPSMNLGSTAIIPSLHKSPPTSSVSNTRNLQKTGTDEQNKTDRLRKRQNHRAKFSPSLNSSRSRSSPRLPSPTQPLSRPSSGSTASRPSHRDGFEIAVICALKAEYDAVALLFDEYWDDEGDPYGRAPGDENTYLTGKIHKHAVVLVLLPGMGKVNAARAAANFRSSYRGIRLALLVGICGGVPKDSEGRDILLGDVVISTQVIEYDLVRRFPDRPRRKRDLGDSHGRASTGIRGFVGTLQTKFQSQRLESRTIHYLADLQSKVQTTEYEYPGASNDRLFQSTYRHRHHHEGRCSICSRCNEKAHPVCDEALTSSCSTLRCDQRYLVPRDRLRRQTLDTRRSNLVIHFGAIASGDSVMRSGEDRDEIAQMENVIAFEMEGSGVWDFLPCIVIKGVCDYADCHKNKDWQSFACATAASAMKSVLERYIRTDRS
ncbi:hypothetical protein BDV30DRAFT_239508 [Aspergillus minisclerotigenes]|uniref:Uncharacterized protein n=1 Tax=Aspergillus minisclerotigenes TaxID=656917 RepID=A0A5N6J2T8_9EURO|nr:hypothetical protein BDV30DRAFT_239508 [Aspergillus minisclerotigenes]